MDFEEFVTLLGPKLTAAGLPDKFNGTDFDSVFWKVLSFVATRCLAVQKGGVQREQLGLNSGQPEFGAVMGNVIVKPFQEASWHVMSPFSRCFVCCNPARLAACLEGSVARWKFRKYEPCEMHDSPSLTGHYLNDKNKIIYTCSKKKSDRTPYDHIANRHNNSSKHLQW